MILRHIHVWRIATDDAKDDTERQFYLSQLRRRCLSSSGVAVLGIIFTGLLLARGTREPYIMTVLLGSALIIMVLIFILACLDVFASRQILIREHQMSHKAKLELLKEHQRLKKKIREAETEEGSQT